jgi:homoaconitase/3-isopropylmalate dehydratase large subunit
MIPVRRIEGAAVVPDRGPRTHLMSTAMAAAAALTGRITDPWPVTA